MLFHLCWSHGHLLRHRLLTLVASCVQCCELIFGSIYFSFIITINSNAICSGLNLQRNRVGFKPFLISLDHSGEVPWNLRKFRKIYFDDTQLKFEGLELSIPLVNGRNSWSVCGRTGVDPARGLEWIQPSGTILPESAQQRGTGKVESSPKKMQKRKYLNAIIGQ